MDRSSIQKWAHRSDADCGLIFEVGQGKDIEKTLPRGRVLSIVPTGGAEGIRLQLTLF
jgi:hypothetical protein